MTTYHDIYDTLPLARKLYERTIAMSQEAATPMNLKSDGFRLSAEDVKFLIGIPPVDPVEPIQRYTPKRIIRNGPATIVMWADGTKTIVKRAPDEADNEYDAFTAALAIKIFGSNSRLKKLIQGKTEEQK